MKQFIRYLYEYEQGKRVRNVGFVRVEQTEEATLVHILSLIHISEPTRP